MLGLSKIAARIAIAAVAIILVLGFLQVRSYQQAAQRAAQSKVDRGQAGAARESAADALSEQGNVSRRAAEAEALSRSNEKEIRDAPGANDPVSDAASAAARRSLCRRAAYRHHPDCRLQ